MLFRSTKKLGGNTVQTSEGSYSLQQAAKNFPVTLYVTECGEFCNSARAHLKKRGIPYTEKNPTDPKETEAFKKISGGSIEVPLMVVGTLRTIKGYLASDWDAALERWKQLPTDPGATYAKQLVLDASSLEPMVTFGTNPGMGIPISGMIPDPAHVSDEIGRAHV